MTDPQHEGWKLAREALKAALPVIADVGAGGRLLTKKQEASAIFTQCVEAVRALAASPPPPTGQVGISSACAPGIDSAGSSENSPQWRDIESAPRDGTRLLLWTIHQNAAYSDDPEGEYWAAVQIGAWTDHNGGGWTWHGMAGRHTHWMPLPPPPSAERLGDAATTAQVPKLTQTLPTGGPGREEVARLIDETAWQLYDELVRVAGLPPASRPPHHLRDAATALSAERRQLSLDKADRILALFPSREPESPSVEDRSATHIRQEMDALEDQLQALQTELCRAMGWCEACGGSGREPGDETFECGSCEGSGKATPNAATGAAGSGVLDTKQEGGVS